MTFENAFFTAQVAMGLTHYCVTFKEASDGNYASVEADPENCIAVVTYDRERCEREQCNESTATHEALHLALADLVHAYQSGSRMAGMEQERFVRRFDAIATKAIFAK